MILMIKIEQDEVYDDSDIDEYEADSKDFIKLIAEEIKETKKS